MSLEAGRRRRLLRAERAAEAGAMSPACICVRAEVRLVGCGCAARDGRVSPLRRLAVRLGLGRMTVEIGADALDVAELAGVGR